MVAKIVILATWEAETGMIVFTHQPRQKVHKTSSQTMAVHSGVYLSFPGMLGKHK
jgi:hypothetical protein